jgi:hypothetical protein
VANLYRSSSSNSSSSSSSSAATNSSVSMACSDVPHFAVIALTSHLALHHPQHDRMNQEPLRSLAASAPARARPPARTHVTHPVRLLMPQLEVRLHQTHPQKHT